MQLVLPALLSWAFSCMTIPFYSITERDDRSCSYVSLGMQLLVRKWFVWDFTIARACTHAHAGIYAQRKAPIT